MPRALCPASSAGGFTNTFGAAPAGGWYAAPEALPSQTRDRKAELLARFFEALCGGRTTARGSFRAPYSVIRGLAVCIF